jgi:glycine cleavage system H protein
MPVAGVITATNEGLLDSPELVNSDPYGEAWMLRIEIGDKSALENLMDAEDYEEYCNERSE